MHSVNQFHFFFGLKKKNKYVDKKNKLEFYSSPKLYTLHMANGKYQISNMRMKEYRFRL